MTAIERDRRCIPALAELPPRSALIDGEIVAGAGQLGFTALQQAIKAGGPFAFADAAFGPLIGFATAWSYWTLVWVGNGAVAVGAVTLSGASAPLRASYSNQYPAVQLAAHVEQHASGLAHLLARGVGAWGDASAVFGEDF